MNLPTCTNCSSSNLTLRPGSGMAACNLCGETFPIRPQPAIGVPGPLPGAEALKAIAPKFIEPPPAGANTVQHGGNHYKGKTIQPWDFIEANHIPFLEGNAIKYLTRWRDKGGVEDLKKAIHYIQKRIELEEAAQQPPLSPDQEERLLQKLRP